MADSRCTFVPTNNGFNHNYKIIRNGFRFTIHILEKQKNPTPLRRFFWLFPLARSRPASFALLGLAKAELPQAPPRQCPLGLTKALARAVAVQPEKNRKGLWKSGPKRLPSRLFHMERGPYLFHMERGLGLEHDFFSKGTRSRTSGSMSGG